MNRVHAVWYLYVPVVLLYVPSLASAKATRLSGACTSSSSTPPPP